ncbi:hypothetical protein [Arthrobacter sp. Soil762]|uniref:hypothetical protein n=1 Tax=Arthrobacter sp. Soil762 TaxID=1736401 RepID=UPI0006FFE6F7|nr:hypothetical protein [Arthrobacter sp. Soil762]KRE72607.1 hypothetical protein ASG77_08015 [Arthrobacter sp. Soil762]
MTVQPIESPTEQDWLGNPVKPTVESYLHNGHRMTLQQAVNSLSELDHVEAAVEAAVLSPELRALESTRAEEAMQLALAVEDKARGEVLKAAAAIDEFARKAVGA